MDEDGGEVDLAIAAWREDGRWSLAALPPRSTQSLEQLIGTLRQLVAEGGALGFVVAEEDFFLAIRVMPEGSARLLLSDLGAALDWPIAEEAAALLGVELPEDDEDLEEIEPVGEIGLFTDMGMPLTDMELILDDPDLFPDEQVAAIAARLGFGEQLAAMIDSLDR